MDISLNETLISIKPSLPWASGDFDKVNLKHIKEPGLFADISKGDGGRSVMSAIFKSVASALTAPRVSAATEAQCPNLRLQGLTLSDYIIKPRLFN